MREAVRLILGTMTFGEQVFGEDVKKFLQCFFDKGGRELDTAYVYNEGECERLLGEALKDIDRSRYSIATKANPRITGRLDKAAVIDQCTESLQRLHIDCADILYLHFPDPATPVESALEGCAVLHEAGKFRELGLSNFPAWLVAEAQHICQTHGWVRPTVYQGVYNPLSRHAERELDRALDYYGMRFYAYNPLAGGLLTDKYSCEDRTLKEGRFVNRPNYQKRYWKDSYFDAIAGIKAACGAEGISVVEASYRWLAFHSMLKPQRGDGILIGASKLPHLAGNMGMPDGGPLPPALVETIDAAWALCKADAPEYFTYYTPQKA